MKEDKYANKKVQSVQLLMHWANGNWKVCIVTTLRQKQIHHLQMIWRIFY